MRFSFSGNYSEAEEQVFLIFDSASSPAEGFVQQLCRFTIITKLSFTIF